MRMLSHDVLTNAVRVYELIQLAAQDSRSGNEAQARARLFRADSLVAGELPLLRGVLAAQAKAAQALNLSQSPSVRVLASIGVPQPHPDAANSHASPPHQPTPGVA